MARQTTKVEWDGRISPNLDDRLNDRQRREVKRFVAALVEAPEHVRESTTRAISRIVPVAQFPYFVVLLLEYLTRPTADPLRAAAHATLLELGSEGTPAVVAAMIAAREARKERLAFDFLLELAMTLPTHERLVLGQKLVFACSTSDHPELRAGLDQLDRIIGGGSPPSPRAQSALHM